MSASDSVVASLRSEILATSLAPGKAVTEALVASTYDVARPTARTAIDRLVDEGLLVREPHHAARVRRLSRDDIDDLFVARAAIEAAAVELLAATATVPAEAVAADGDFAFHQALVRSTGSTRLPGLHDLLMGEIQLGIAQIETHRLRTPTEIATEHAGILDAIAAGDVELAGRLTRSHVLASRDRLVAHHERS